MAPLKPRSSEQQRCFHSLALKRVIAIGLETLVIFGLISSPWEPLLTVAARPEKVSYHRLSGDAEIVHLLNRITLGARPGDVDRVRQLGTKKFIEQQLHPEQIPDPVIGQKLADLETLEMTSPELVDNFPPPNLVKQFQKLQQGSMTGPESNDGGAMHKDDAMAASLPPLKNQQEQALQAMQSRMAQNPAQMIQGPRKVIVELQQAMVLRAIYSERQLYEEMVDFWENHFNVFAGKGADHWLLTEYDRDVIRPHAMGKFKDLVEATAHSPAMLFYLDNWLSVDPNGAQNQARNIRRFRGNGPFAMRRFDGFGRPLPQTAQNQANIPVQGVQQKRGLNENYARELMELHTLGVDGGYTQKDVTEVARCFTGWTIRAPNQGGSFVFNPRLHDNGVKYVLGHKISGHGERDGEAVIDILVHHPSTAHFIAKKLVTRFVSDNPPESLVERVAQTYLRTDGDIREMLRTILYSPEFNSTEAYRAKVKSPFELVVSAIRASGGDTNASPALLQFIARMGEPLFMYQAPTGYPDRASEWLNSGTLLTRMNFALALAANRIPGTNVNLQDLLGDVPGDEADAIRSRLLKIYLNDDVTEKTRSALNKDVTTLFADNPALAVSAVGNRALPVEMAGLILGSPEFQRR